VFVETIKLGIKNLLLHKLRSFLTLLGVILGVGSVVAMLAIGEGSKQEALERIRQLGANNVIVRSVKPGSAGNEETSTASQTQVSRVLDYGLKYKDLDRLLATLPTVERAVPVALLRKDVQHSGRLVRNGRILGTTPEFLSLKNLNIRRGRFLGSIDMKRVANVVVVGSGAAEKLFGYSDPIDETLLIGEDVYRVVGVLESQSSGAETPGAVGQSDFNDDLYIPLCCAQKRFGELQMILSAGSRVYERTQLSEITLAVSDTGLVTQTADMVRNILEDTHPGGRDFEIQVPLQLLKQAEQEKRIWNLVLGSIAGISLLVGGIGIMNIMLATVTERIREIGIRRALGARRRDILTQFLAETVVLSSIGGILGIVLGVAIPLVVHWLSGIETVVSLWSVLLAFGISTTIGVVFGIYPARRAAWMDPIEALRHN
jgi:putative ABC transport system permease protein